MSGHGEREPDIHTAGIPFHRRIHKSLYAGKCNNLVKFEINFALFHSQHCATEINIFPTGELAMESRAHFKKGADAATDLYPSFGRFRNSRKNLEQSTLARPIESDKTDHFATLYLKRHIV